MIEEVFDDIPRVGNGWIHAANSRQVTTTCLYHSYLYPVTQRLT